jgi:hypothetical protein
MPGDPFVGDRIRLQRALLNYCANAVRFTESGSVVLSISVVEDHPVDALIRFEVADTGFGIEGRKLTRLFNPFEQADASISRAYGGTGLGLAIARRLAHLMGGEAGADSTPGIGSTFWFTARLRKAPPSAVVAAAVGMPGSAEDALRRDYADRRACCWSRTILSIARSLSHCSGASGPQSAKHATGMRRLPQSSSVCTTSS